MKITYKYFTITSYTHIYELEYKYPGKHTSVTDGKYRNLDEVLKRMIHITLMEKDEYTLGAYLAEYSRLVSELKTNIKIPINFD